MQELKYDNFIEGLEGGLRSRKPLNGQIELTHRCNLDCVHCYCQGSNNKDRELSTSQWKEIFDQLHREGCLWLTFTGGEPLLRRDFLELYDYARRKGFLTSILTNATLLAPDILRFFKGNPPFSIEVSLYGVTPKVYETITQVEGSFSLVMENIHKMLEIKMPLVLKTVALKQNKNEILKVKALTEKLLGKKRFKFDSFIFARLNGDTTPCNFRLTPDEILELEKSDIDVIAQRRGQAHASLGFKRAPEFIYQCNSWWTNFFINPYGRLQFCILSKEYSYDLTKGSFAQGFYNEFPKLLSEKFKTNAKCKDCSLRKVCYYCPARVYLEAGDEEASVDYYCRLAKARQNWIEVLKHGNV